MLARGEEGAVGRVSEPRARVVALCLGIALPLLASEVGLRWLPVATGLRSVPVNRDAPVFHFEPGRDFVYSKRWNFRMVNRGRINNAGYVNDDDYSTSSDRPVVAVIGDSYVEAAMVPWSETVTARLGNSLDGHARVYSFAASGAPLSQYLVWASEARTRYGASALVFVVVGNDFDESLLSHKQDPGFHYFDDSRGGENWELTRVDYTPGRLRWVARNSALVRYVLLNLHGDQAVRRLRALLEPRPTAETELRYVGNIAAEATPVRLASSEQAVRRFFDLLPEMTGLPAHRILFLVDGMRPQLYDGRLEQAEDSFFGRMRSFFLAQALGRGYGAIDLQPIFIQEHRRSGVRFEYEIDAHWNAEGHRQAALAVLRQGLPGVVGALPQPVGAMSYTSPGNNAE